MSASRRQSVGGVTRREFLATGALAAALPGVTRGAWAGGSDVLKVGLVGCGGRGTGAAVEALLADRGAVLWAAGDTFAGRIESSLASIAATIREKQEESEAAPPGAPEKVQAPPERRFTGFDAYQKVIASGVDVVILATTPAFRPEHLAAAVAAGKHVFCEKPVAVDGAGVRSCLASAAEAQRLGLSLVSGFCWRYSDAERATYARLHEGAIGAVRAAYTTYNAGGFPAPHPREPAWSDVEFQLRSWHYFAHLSGDHIVEQAVHAIDKIAWAMKDVPPLRCTAVGGRQARPNTPETGNIYDHFGVAYEYADGARGFHMCRHFPNTPFDNSDYIVGTRGTCVVDGWKPTHRIEGENAWSYEGPRRNMYQNEHDALFAAIRAGEPINNGVRQAHSTLMAIMGRMAAYTGQTVTWEQALNSEESLTPAKWDWTDFPVPPVAVPGVTKLR